MTVAIAFGVNLLFIAAVVGLLHWLGRSAKARLDSAEAAKKLFQAEYPEAQIAEIGLAAAGDGALLVLEGEPAIGLITALGADWLVRKIEPQNFGTASAAGAGRLTLRLREFTAPRLTLDLGTAQRAALWRDRLAMVQA